MVNIKEIKKKSPKVLCACRIPKEYKKELDKNNISFTDFVLKALEETFGYIK